MKVQIRYNTNFPKTSTKKWRVIIDNIQHLVDDVRIETPTWTSEDVVTGDDGNPIVKYHISTECSDCVFQEDTGSETLAWLK